MGWTLHARCLTNIILFPNLLRTVKDRFSFPSFSDEKTKPQKLNNWSSEDVNQIDPFSTPWQKELSKVQLWPSYSSAAYPLWFSIASLPGLDAGVSSLPSPHSPVTLCSRHTWLPRQPCCATPLSLCLCCSLYWDGLLPCSLLLSGLEKLITSVKTQFKSDFNYEASPDPSIKKWPLLALSTHPL